MQGMGEETWQTDLWLLFSIISFSPFPPLSLFSPPPPPHLSSLPQLLAMTHATTVCGHVTMTGLTSGTVLVRFEWPSITLPAD